MRKALSLFLFQFAAFCGNNSFCQAPLFKDGDRICFIGSSIAMNGANFHYINLFYATRYPGRKVTFLNSGISGDVTGDILKRMESDILINKPSWAVMMLEENDLNPSLYYKEREKEPGIMEKRQKALENWFRNSEIIIQKLQEAKVNVILETPTIYDQTGKLPARNAFGINDALKKCARHLENLSVKYKLPLVDCWNRLLNVNKVIQKKDITNSIIGHDRMHVSKLGYLIMADQFLNSPHTNKKVSGFLIDARKNKVLRQDNCTIENVRDSAHTLSFIYRGKSLPFPSPEGLNVDSLHTFTDQMNADIIQVKGLVNGKYRLQIDTAVAGIFSNTLFEKGINLSTIKHTPQYLQAHSVLMLFDEYWKTERTLRIMKYVEYSHLGSFTNKSDMEEVKKHFDSILENSKTSDNLGFFKNVFKIYLDNKPGEKELGSKLSSLQNTIYHINSPSAHTYKIEKVAN